MKVTFRSEIPSLPSQDEGELRLGDIYQVGKEKYVIGLDHPLDPIADKYSQEIAHGELKRLRQINAPLYRKIVKATQQDDGRVEASDVTQVASGTNWVSDEIWGNNLPVATHEQSRNKTFYYKLAIAALAAALMVTSIRGCMLEETIKSQEENIELQEEIYKQRLEGHELEQEYEEQKPSQDRPYLPEVKEPITGTIET